MIGLAARACWSLVAVYCAASYVVADVGQIWFALMMLGIAAAPWLDRQE